MTNLMDASLYMRSIGVEQIKSSILTLNVTSNLQM